MIEIVKYNDDDLKDNEIDEVVTRVKAFIVSSKNNMIVGYTDEGFQLIGGYVGLERKLFQHLKILYLTSRVFNLMQKIVLSLSMRLDIITKIINSKNKKLQNQA